MADRKSTAMVLDADFVAAAAAVQVALDESLAVL